MELSDIPPDALRIYEEVRDEWMKISLSTETADFDSAEAAISRLYVRSGHEIPRFVRAASPIEASAYLKSVRGRKSISIGDQNDYNISICSTSIPSLYELCGRFSDHFGLHVCSPLRHQISSAVYFGASPTRRECTMYYGSLGSRSYGRYDLARRLGVVYPTAADGSLDDFCTISRSCGFIYAYENLCVVADRPSLLRRDDSGRLHCDFGPAVSYRGDGFSLYFIHGTQIPSKWITNRSSLTPQIALTWENIEQRRVACELLGWEAILSALSATTIDRDEDPLIGDLVEVHLPGSGRERFLRVTCGTGRNFALPVPPNMQTALEANAWTIGFSGSDFLKPEVRT